MMALEWVLARCAAGRTAVTYEELVAGERTRAHRAPAAGELQPGVGGEDRRFEAA